MSETASPAPSRFVKATRRATAIKLAIQGISFSGKTMSAIKVAKGLAKGRGNGRVAVLDSENGSASLYDFLDFDTLELRPPFKPAAYIEAIRDAVEANYPAMVIDSGSHAWEWILGYKDELDQVKGSFNNWGKVKPLWKSLKDAILQSPIDIIVCFRERSEYAVEESTNGQGNKRAEVRKLGVKAIAEPDSEYEFSTVWKLAKDTHLAMVEKDRTGLWDGRAVLLDEAHGVEIAMWRASGQGGVDALQAGDEWALLASGFSTEFTAAQDDAEKAYKDKARVIFQRLKIAATVSVKLKDLAKAKGEDFTTLVIDADGYGATTAEALIRYVCGKCDTDAVALVREQNTGQAAPATQPADKPADDKPKEEPAPDKGQDQAQAPQTAPEDEVDDLGLTKAQRMQVVEICDRNGWAVSVALDDARQNKCHGFEQVMEHLGAKEQPAEKEAQAGKKTKKGDTTDA